MKKKRIVLISILAVLAIIVSIGIYNFYPTREKVMNGKNYDITQSEFNEEMVFSFNPKQYVNLEDGKGTMVNLPIYEGHGSQIIVEKITHNFGTYNVYVNNVTKWNFLSGSALSIWRMKNENGERSFASISPAVEIYNEKNEALKLQLARGKDEILVFEIDEEEFRNSNMIIIKMKGFYLNDYKFSFK